MAQWWDTDGARWEREFDEVVRVAGRRRLRESLERIHRLRSWQRRQAEHGVENHSWHDAELLWLEGVVLERARRTRRAALVWARLATLLEDAGASEAWYLPRCHTCARRELTFAPSWLTTARRLRAERGDQATLVASLSRATRSRSSRPGARKGAVQQRDEADKATQR
jgi:hypothetical protein